MILYAQIKEKTNRKYYFLKIFSDNLKEIAYDILRKEN